MRYIAALLAACLVVAPAARAQTEAGFPDRPVRMIQPGVAGSGADALARLVASALPEALRQPVVVETMPSGGGVVGILAAARARRDGSTLLAAISSLQLGPLLDPSLPYRMFRDFIPVSQTILGASVLVVRPNFPARDFAAFAALVRADPEAYQLGNFGHGTSSELHGALLNRRLGVNLALVAYQGGPPVIRDIIAGHICCGFLDLGSVSAQLRGGELRPLAVTGPQRIALLPDTPTFEELGLAGFAPRIWHGFFLPAGTPDAVVAVFGRAIAGAIARPDIAARIREMGFEPVGSTPAEFTTMLRTDEPIWERTVRETHEP